MTQYLEGREDAPELHWTGSLNRFDREQYRKLCRESDARAREWVDGYWYDANRKDGAAAWSKLDTTVGSRASLCGSVRDALALMRKQGIEVALRRALLEPWANDDDAATTGWDPAAVKLGASITGGKEPTKAKHRTVAAATWLAWESLPLFPARWIAGERHEVVFVVPHRPVSLAGARMMLLSGPRMDGAELSAQGWSKWTTQVWKNRRSTCLAPLARTTSGGYTPGSPRNGKLLIEQPQEYLSRV